MDNLFLVIFASSHFEKKHDDFFLLSYPALLCLILIPELEKK